MPGLPAWWSVRSKWHLEPSDAANALSGSLPIHSPSDWPCAILEDPSPHSMRPLDRTQLARTHRGKWIALKADRKTVIATGKNVSQALAAARKNGVEQPIITRLPLHPTGFVGGHH